MPATDEEHQMQDVSMSAARGAEIHNRASPGTSVNEDLDVVGWEGDDDPEHPYNDAHWRIMTTGILLATLGFLVPLSSAIVAPATPELMAEFNSDSELLEAFVVSVFVLGLAFGGMLWAPLSEIYGRLWIYHGTNLGFILFTIACALAPSLGSLIGFRFLAGFFGSCNIANGAGSFADMMPEERRGVFLSLYVLGPICGPVIGPVIGGFLSAAKGWRWVFWLTAILAGAVAIVMAVVCRETYGPVLLQRKVKRLQRETGNERLAVKDDIQETPWAILRHGIVRPLRLLVLSPVGLVCALYMAIVYGILNLLFTSISSVYIQNYGFAPNISGLAYLGLGIGSFLGMTTVGATSDKYVARQAAKNGGQRRPEDRIILTPIGALVMPAGLFVYGWTAQYQVHWIVPIIAEGIIGLGLMTVFFSTILYIVDSFTVFAASALAANGFIRAIGGGLLPLAGLTLYSSLGVGWGNSVLGFICLLIFPISLILLKYGAYLRVKFPVKKL